MAISPQRMAEIQAMMQQGAQAPTTGGMTAQRRAEIEAMIKQQQQPQQEGTPGVRGFLSGLVKTIVDAPRQFAESGQTIGRALSQSGPGQFIAENITRPLINLLPEQAQQNIGQAASAARQVSDVSTTQSEALKRTGTAERAGETAANIGMFFLPGGAVGRGARALEGTAALSKLGKFAAPVARGIAEGTASTAIAAGQTGSLKEGAKAGLADLGVNVALGSLGPLARAATAGRRLAIPGTQVAQDVAQAAQRVGVNLPASSLSKSAPVRTIEQFASRGFGAGSFTQKVDDAVAKLNDFARGIVTKAGTAKAPSEAGQILADGLETFKKNFIKGKTDLYAKADVGSINATLRPQNTYNIVNDVVTRLRRASKIGADAPELKFWENKLAGLSTQKGAIRAVRINDAIELLKDINRRTSFGDVIATGDKAELRKLAATLSEEIDEALKGVRPDLARALDKANAFYKQGVEFMDSSLARSINSLSATPDKIFEMISRPSTSVESIKQAMQLAGKNADTIRASILDDMITTATRDGEVIGNVLENLLKKFGQEKLNVLFKPEQLSALQDLSTLSKALKEGQKIAEGSQTAYLTKIMGMVGTLFANPLLGLKLIVADKYLSKFVMSAKGQDFLLRGVPLAPVGMGVERFVKKAAPIAGKAGAATLSSLGQSGLPEERTQ